jgi:hypothetical protein
MLGARQDNMPHDRDFTMYPYAGWASVRRELLRFMQASVREPLCAALDMQ